MKYISANEYYSLTDDELSLILYVIQEYMGLDPLFIKSIKKKKIYTTLINIQNQLNDNGKEIYDQIIKKIFIEYTQ